MKNDTIKTAVTDIKQSRTKLLIAIAVTAVVVGFASYFLGANSDVTVFLKGIQGQLETMDSDGNVSTTTVTSDTSITVPAGGTISVTDPLSVR